MADINDFLDKADKVAGSVGDNMKDNSEYGGVSNALSDNVNRSRKAVSKGRDITKKINEKRKLANAKKTANGAKNITKAGKHAETVAKAKKLAKLIKAAMQPKMIGLYLSVIFVLCIGLIIGAMIMNTTSKTDEDAAYRDVEDGGEGDPENYTVEEQYTVIAYAVVGSIKEAYKQGEVKFQKDLDANKAKYKSSKSDDIKDGDEVFNVEESIKAYKRLTTSAQVRTDLSHIIAAYSVSMKDKPPGDGTNPRAGFFWDITSKIWWENITNQFFQYEAILAKNELTKEVTKTKTESKIVGYRDEYVSPYGMISVEIRENVEVEYQETIKYTEIYLKATLSPFKAEAMINEFFEKSPPVYDYQGRPYFDKYDEHYNYDTGELEQGELITKGIKDETYYGSSLKYEYTCGHLGDDPDKCSEDDSPVKKSHLGTRTKFTYQVNDFPETKTRIEQEWNSETGKFDDVEIDTGIPKTIEDQVTEYQLTMYNPADSSIEGKDKGYIEGIQEIDDMVWKIMGEDGPMWEGEVVLPELIGDISPFFGGIDMGEVVKHSSEGGKVSSFPGFRIHPIKKTPSTHGGTDYMALKGFPLFSITSGTVEVATFHKSYGYYVKVIDANGFGFLYAHMDAPPLVSKGQEISAGTQIGVVGSSGDSTGPHLHLEMYVDWKMQASYDAYVKLCEMFGVPPSNVKGNT